jgi:coenzyme F420-0:L-glutamate ligase/coenzyme F420-1:gamma-L-glutamate ligase
VIRDWDFGDHAGSDSLFRDPADDIVRRALTAWDGGSDWSDTDTEDDT